VRRPRTIGQSRTLKAAGLGGVGTAATGAGAALGAVSSGASEAGYLMQTLGGMSQWFVVAGIVLMFVSIGLTVWARLDDFRNDEGRAMGVS